MASRSAKSGEAVWCWREAALIVSYRTGINHLSQERGRPVPQLQLDQEAICDLTAQYCWEWRRIVSRMPEISVVGDRHYRRFFAVPAPRAENEDQLAATNVVSLRNGMKKPKASILGALPITVNALSIRTNPRFLKYQTNNMQRPFRSGRSVCAGFDVSPHRANLPGALMLLDDMYFRDFWRHFRTPTKFLPKYRRDHTIQKRLEQIYSITFRGSYGSKKLLPVTRMITTNEGSSILSLNVTHQTPIWIIQLGPPPCDRRTRKRRDIEVI